MNKNNLNTLIQNFTPISLEEMDKVEFLNRVDNKFVFHISELLELLNDCQSEYRILDVNGVRNHFYDSLYFDTSDFLMYHLHHNQRLNRYKVRFRKYVNSNGLTFFEIKFKDNKEKTFKKRKKYNDIEYSIHDELYDFLSKNIAIQNVQWLPSLQVQYHRITLVHQNLNERVTIDTQLKFNNFENAYFFENLVIAEVKRNNYAEHTAFLKLLKKHRIREGGLSKYCTGMALTYSHIRKNNFLPKLRYFEKINSL